MRRAWLIRGAAYLALAVLLTWPLAASPGSVVPGADRTDLWNSLWSLWYVEDAVSSGMLPWSTTLLGHPHGGVLWPSDLVNAVLGLPLVALFGPVLAWSLLVLGHITASGMAAHGLSASLGAGRGAWVAGVSWAMAPILVSGIHNGTSEAVVGVWLPLAVWGLVRAQRTGKWGAGAALLALCSISSWYAGVAAGFFWLALLGLGPGRRGLLLAGLLGGLLAAPVAVTSLTASSHVENLVGIKGAREVSTVRRTIGSADWRGWFVPGDFRSPDFAVSSRYGERFVHCHYLGWVLLGASGLVLVRRRGPGFAAVGGGLGLVAAMGPVVVMDGQAVVLGGDMALALPWLAVERLPGLSSLSLLYRLAMAPSLALALLAAHASQRFALPLAVVIALELRLVSPASSLPELTPTPANEALVYLASAPDGAVMNFPVVGGRAYLYEQTVHGQPLAGSLNFPNNSASIAVWDAVLKNEALDPEARLARVQAVARQQGVRYVVVHDDPDARPDHHDLAVALLMESLTPAAVDGSIQVLVLW
jgi:hypothetical protein